MRDCTPIAEGRLEIACELSKSKWLLRLASDVSQEKRVVSLSTDWLTLPLEKATSRAKQHWGLSEDAPVFACFEAGRDGFWPARYFESLGITPVMVDSASIDVKRRARTAKTDRLDVEKLGEKLRRYLSGEKKVWSVVRVPSEELEDAREGWRERDQLKRQVTRLRNQIKSQLALQGIRLAVDDKLPKRLDEVRTPHGKPLGERFKGSVRRKYEAFKLMLAQKEQVEKEEFERVANSSAPDDEKIRQLMLLRGIGDVGATGLVREFFWREFSRTREVSGATGLVGVPHLSGTTHHDQAISKTSSQRLRALAVELAWGWIRYQPRSALTQWYMRRFAGGGKRIRRIGIVALARKLLVALWRFLEHGEVPEGAELKP